MQTIHAKFAGNHPELYGFSDENFGLSG